MILSAKPIGLVRWQGIASAGFADGDGSRGGERCLADQLLGRCCFTLELHSYGRHPIGYQREACDEMVADPEDGVNGAWTGYSYDSSMLPLWKLLGDQGPHHIGGDR